MFNPVEEFQIKFASPPKDPESLNWIWVSDPAGEVVSVISAIFPAPSAYKTLQSFWVAVHVKVVPLPVAVLNWTV